MKRILFLAGIAIGMWMYSSCSSDNSSNNSETTAAVSNEAPQAGQSGVQDNDSQKDIVKVAVGSKDHSTLVAAVQAAEYVDVLANAGPFTVFAPVNAAFDKLPAGTVETLLKPENKKDLRNILEYHVAVGVYKTENMQDGQIIGEANGGNVTITKKGNDVFVNGNKILASVPASNGIIHVIDQVLLPPAK